MNGIPLSAGDRRALIAGAALIIAMVTVALALPRYRSWSSMSATRMQIETARLARAEASIAASGRTKVALAATRARLVTLDSTLLTGTDAASAGTALSDAISTAAEASGATLGSIQLRRDSAVTIARLTRIGARTSVAGDIEALALVLESLEVGSPLLAVREWSISGGSTSGAPGQAESLRMEMLVEGLARLTPTAGVVVR